MGNYYYLREMSEEPHAVANYLKRVLKFMGEPLCTFKLYGKFKEMENNKDRAKEIC